MTDVSSLAYLAPIGRMFGAVGPALPGLLEVYRDGGGVLGPLGPDARESQADANRPWFESRLGPALSGISTAHDILSRPGARFFDIGSGGGWSSIALARANPAAAVTGIDIDEHSVTMATINARAAGVADRVTFLHQDASTLPPERFDAAFTSSVSTTCHDRSTSSQPPARPWHPARRWSSWTRLSLMSSRPTATISNG